MGCQEKDLGFTEAGWISQANSQRGMEMGGIRQGMVWTEGEKRGSTEKDN